MNDPGSGADPSVPLRDMARHARTAAGLAWHAGRARVLGMVLLAVAVGVSPVATAWLTRSVLDGLVGDASPNTLAVLAVTLAATGVASVALPPLVRYVESELRRQTRVLATDRLFTAFHERLRGLARLENPPFHTRIRMAQQAAASGPADLVNATIGMVTSALTLSGPRSPSG